MNKNTKTIFFWMKTIICLHCIILLSVSCQHQYMDPFGNKIESSITDVCSASGNIYVRMQTSVEKNRLIKEKHAGRIFGGFGDGVSEIISDISCKIDDKSIVIPSSYLEDITFPYKKSLAVSVVDSTVRITFSGSGGEYGYDCVFEIDDKYRISRYIKE